MAMNTPDAGAADERRRLRKLAQSAMNADRTVGQVEALLTDMGPLLDGLAKTATSLDDTIANMDATIAKMDATLNKVGATVDQMTTIVNRLEAITGRVEQVVLIAEAAMRPLGYLEAAGRGLAGRLGILGRD